MAKTFTGLALAAGLMLAGVMLSGCESDAVKLERLRNNLSQAELSYRVWRDRVPLRPLLTDTVALRQLDSLTKYENQRDLARRDLDRFMAIR